MLENETTATGSRVYLGGKQTKRGSRLLATLSLSVGRNMIFTLFPSLTTSRRLSNTTSAPRKAIMFCFNSSFVGSTLCRS